MNDFQASDELVAYVKQAEGLKLSVYTDAAGFPTWGCGHKCMPGEAIPPEITEAQADAVLAADLLVAGSAVRRHVTVEMSQSQFDGFTDFAFNLGEGSFAGSTMLRMFNAGDVEGAAMECRKWDHAHVAGHLVVLAGLTARREWDALHIDPIEETNPNKIVDNSAPVVWAPGEGPDATVVVPDPNLQNAEEVAANLATIQTEAANEEASEVHADPVIPPAVVEQLAEAPAPSAP